MTNKIVPLLILINIFIITNYPNNTRAEIIGSISGKVINRETGKGIHNAIVSVENNIRLRWKTDADGNYTLYRLSAGNYRILVDTPLKYDNDHKPEKRVLEVSVGSGNNLTEVNFYIKKMGSVSGVVYEKLGVTPNNPGRIYASSVTDTKHPEKIIVSGWTDTSGYFKIKMLPEGERWDLLYVNWTKGNTNIYKYDKPVVLNSNEDIQNLKFNLVDIGGTKIYGSVKDTKEKYINNESCRVLFSQGAITIICKIDKGQYLMQGDIPPGEYKVMIDLFKYDPEGKPFWKKNDMGLINIRSGEKKEFNLVYDGSKENDIETITTFPALRSK